MNYQTIKSGHPTQPSDRKTCQQETGKTTTRIIHQKYKKCKNSLICFIRSNYMSLLLVVIIGGELMIYSSINEPTQTPIQDEVILVKPVKPLENKAPDTELEQQPSYFSLNTKEVKAATVNLEELSKSWAMEAGYEQRYPLTDEERFTLAQVITAEAVGEPYAGKMAVAQCILQACEDDNIRPMEVIKKYKYAGARAEPTKEAIEAVTAVFDFGQIVTIKPIKYFYAPARTESKFHESQIYVMTINNHKFFEEVNHE